MSSFVSNKSYFSMFSLLLVLLTFVNNFQQIQGFSVEATRNLVNVSSNSSEAGANRDARRSVVSGGIFSLVSFENVPCNTTSGDIGTCYSARECTNLGGSNAGICAGGYGVCCYNQVTCGGTITANNTYFVNPDYPSPTAGPLTCTVTVNQLSGATWLYYDYQSFDLRNPSGSCTNDTSQTVTSSGSTSTKLCGDNSGRDEYLPWSASSARTARQSGGTAVITITLSSGTDTRLWKIRVVQFKATDGCAPPAGSGCTQYVRNMTGTIESANYKNGEGEIVGTNSCVRQCFALPTGYCSVDLSTTCTSSSNCGFMVPGTAPSTCTTDYLQVSGTNYCGETFGTTGTVTATRTGSLNYIPINFCTGSSNPNMDVGYRLMYTLRTC